MNLREFARDQSCTVQIPGVCNRRTDTTVLAHYPWLAPLSSGGSMKCPDWQAGHACCACHDVLDGRAKVARVWTTEPTPMLMPMWERVEFAARSMCRTLARVKEAGL